MTFEEQVEKLLDSASEVAVKLPEALKLLHTVYKQMFGEPVQKHCGDCLTKAFQRIQKTAHLNSLNNSVLTNKNLETMKIKKFDDRNFVLKQGKVLDLGAMGVLATNDNMTDELGVRILTDYPNMAKYFDKYPVNEQGELDLSGIDISEAGTRKKELKKASKKYLEIFGKNPEDNATVEQINADIADGSEARKTLLFKQAATNAANQSTTQQTANTTSNVPQSKTSEKTPVKNATTEDKVKNPPHKKTSSTGEKQLPNDGESIKDAAVRYGVSDRTVERAMQSAGIDVKAYKEKFKVAPVIEPVVETPAPVVTSTEASGTTENKADDKEAAKGTDNAAGEAASTTGATE